jgi:hypothetical protein
MDDDFQNPAEMPIPNYINIRTLAQVAAQRAQCCLLLGQSERAFHELSLIYDMRRLLTPKPTCLVSAMIDVAICGLYASTIADGFRLGAWHEPELVALQQQLQQINLPPIVATGLRDERAGICHMFQQIWAGDWTDKFYGSKRSMWERKTDPVYLLLKVAPRGWVYQNLITIATLEQAGNIETFDPEAQLINPRQIARALRETEKLMARWSFYNVLARIAVPNFPRAMQTAAQNQTLVNQALIVCGLERYRLAHSDYPETLDALVPQFVEKLPHDIIGGQPLHYRRTADGKFLLYSVGWNETDDGGQPSQIKNGQMDFTKGDWVWEIAEK